MRRSQARSVARLAFVCAIFFAPESSADGGLGVHWDASAEAGVMKRWQSRAPFGEPGFGPSLQLAGHVALLPLLHTGLYLGGDVSPFDAGGTRTAMYGGPHVKILVPIFPKSMRGWVATGIGLGALYEKSHHSPALGQRVGGDTWVFGEWPLALGVSYKFWPGWSVFTELAGRFLFSGREEDGPPRDRWALGLSIGIMLDR